MPVAAAARQFRGTVRELLESNDPAAARSALNAMPASALASALPAFLCSADARIRWRAAGAMGQALARMADTDMESARRVLRRLLWSLNDESGGIGWGAAEAMGEAVARRERIAREFAPILMALLREDGYHLQYAPVAMQRAALRAVCRAAAVYPQFMSDQAGCLLEYLDSRDACVRALAARALGLLGEHAAAPALRSLSQDDSEVVLDGPDAPEITRVSIEAERALALMKNSQ